MRLQNLALVACLVAPIGCTNTSSSAAEEDAITAEARMITLIKTSQHSVYANISSTSSSALGAALIAATDRGVDVHVLLKAGSHDSTWTMQQHLESNGVDVDVRDDSGIAGVKIVVDAKALVGTKVVTTPSTVNGFLDKFQKAMDGAAPKAGSLRTSGVVVWPMPESSRDRIVSLLGAAQSSIDLEIYQLQERGVVAALKDAAERGVKVRMMLEPKTVGGGNFDAIEKELSAADITVKKTPAKFDSSHNVDHAKFCVLDGKELLFGTGNLVRSGLGGETDDVYANRDFWIEDARSANVVEAQALFEADWNETPTSQSALTHLVVTPDNADAKIVSLIDGAKKRVYVYNQSIDDPDLITHVIAAKQRGVEVRVLVGYQPGFGGPPKNQAVIDQLEGAQIEAQFLKAHYLHAKAVVADDAVYLGSQNFTNGGLRNNRELGEILTDAASVTTVVKTFEADAANP